MYRKIRVVAFALLFTLGMNSMAFAQSFSDVPSSHWAYQYVDRISDLGLMVGDMSGKFRPDDYISKFETAKVLARMAGYKFTDPTAEEKQYFDQCYELHKSYLNLYASKFKKWISTSDREIAFLIEKGILTDDDLNLFVIINSANEEKVTALTRQEAAVFLVRLMGKAGELPSSNSGTLFADDSTIASANKPFVYYLRSKGILSGDTANNFKPKDAITRAAMAVLIDKVYTQMNGGSVGQTPNTNNPSSGNQTLSGTISKLYPQLKAIQVSSSDSFNNKILMTSSDAIITINGEAKTYTDLKENMTVSCTVSNNQLISVAATTSGTVTPPSQPDSTGTYYVIEGTVQSIKTEYSVNYLDIEVTMLNPRGQVYAETRTFSLSPNCEITKNNSKSSFASIAKSDIVKAEYSGSVIYKLAVEEKYKEVEGKLIEKKFSTAMNSAYLVVEDSKANKYEFRVTNSSRLTRKGVGEVSWNEFRVGDAMYIEAEYDTILSASGTGTKSTKEVTVSSIFISKNENYINAADSNGNIEKYMIIPTGVDVYSLRIGSLLKLTLDSKEIQSIRVLENGQSDTYSGTIKTITRKEFSITDYQGFSKEFSYDENTLVYNSSGQKLSVSKLDTTQQVFIITSGSNSNYAKSITILQ